MTKVLLIIIAVLICICVIFFFIIKSQKKKNKSLQNQIIDYENEYEELNEQFEKIKGDMEIEKRHNKELAKKLADISCMSIDDVLHELQDNSKDSLLYT
jgi:predicted RNase H-like nuclease (RuvC/YqgF family)